MNEPQSNIKPLMKLHSSLWWIFITWFAMVTILLALQLDVATIFSTAGLGLIYAGTLLRLVQLGVLFHRSGRTRPLVLSSVLVSLLLVSVLMRYVLQ